MQKEVLKRLRAAYEHSRLPDVTELEAGEFVRDTADRIIATGEQLDVESFPALGNISSAFINRFSYVPTSRAAPEVVYVPSNPRPGQREDGMREAVFVTEWNICWESADLRPELFDDDDLPRRFEWLRGFKGQNIYLMPRGTRHRYFAYRPLYHLLPLRLVRRHGLLPIQRGLWPHYLEDFWIDAALPDGFDERLSRAFADLVWHHLDSGTGHSGFSDVHPIRLLAHNLDFWLPYAHRVAEERLLQMPRVEPENDEQARILEEARNTTPPGVELHCPRKGGMIWQGEAEADEAVRGLVAIADEGGKLRSIIDAVRSSHVEEDFSERWSFAKEDFERKLYRKRNAVSVKFVELDDTVPVHGPDSEVHESLLWEDFLALLNPKEREITVLLRNGYTKLGDIASSMGYANHSPVSKALDRIRRKAQTFLE